MRRADELRTKGDLVRTFLSQGSPRVLVAAPTAVLAARLLVGGWGWVDALVVALTALAVGPVEWLLHLRLLHADDDAWTTRTLGTGHGHRRHHLDPPDIEWLLLRGRDAIVYTSAIALASVLWVVPATLVLGALAPGVGVLGPLLTAITCAYLALAHYEWTHLLEHSRYRPRTRYYRRLVRNHRLHHFRNERHWLGVTSNLGDRMMGTMPAHPGDVPLSDTARTLS